MNRRGVSSIITLALSITVGIALASLLFYTIESSSTLRLAPALSCAQMSLAPPLILQSACSNERGDVLITLFHVPNAKVNDAHFRITTSAEAIESTCGTGCGCELPQEGESKQYTINAENPSQVTLFSEGCALSALPIVPC